MQLETILDPMDKLSKAVANSVKNSEAVGNELLHGPSRQSYVLSCSVIVFVCFCHLLYRRVSRPTVLVARELQQFAREWLEEQGMDYDETCQSEMKRRSVILT